MQNNAFESFHQRINKIEGKKFKTCVAVYRLFQCEVVVN